MRWLEIAAGYDCNCACVGCHSCSADPAQQMASREVLASMQRARAAGARFFWLSGGEPTLRRDFLPILRAARTLGFERVKVQTNGMMFAYPELAARALAAGMTEANFLLRSVDPAVHDALNRRDGSHALLAKGLANLAGRARLEGDVLVTARNTAELPDVVRAYAAQGLVHFNVWLFSASDAGADDVRALVPRLADLREPLREARRVARSLGVGLVSLHTPHCLVEPDEWDLQFDPAGMGLYVENPGGHGFLLSDSPMEQGLWVDACATCAVRGPCRGLRPDYVAIHGPSEAKAVAADDARGRDPRGSVLDL